MLVFAKANAACEGWSPGQRRLHLQQVHGPVDVFLQPTGAPAPETFRWADLVDQQQRLGRGRRGSQRQPVYLLVGTTRRTARPALAGQTVGMDGELWLSMMTTSTKALS